MEKIDTDQYIKDELEKFSLNISRQPSRDVIAFNPTIRACKLGEQIDFPR